MKLLQSNVPDSDLPRLGSTRAQLHAADADFKASFDPKVKQEWCEVIKDIIAMTNSGGGCIVFGVTDDGELSGADIAPILAIDPADITNKIYSYTNETFAAFRVRSGNRLGSQVAILEVGGSRIPIVFSSPGTYAAGNGQQKTAFSRGTVYFRHGAKSEPGTSVDLRAAIDREVERIKEFWLSGIAKVVEAPPGSSVQILDASQVDPQGGVGIQLTTDPKAPAFHAIEADVLYPYRQTELVKKLRAELESSITAHDLLCVRRVHNTDKNPTYSYKAQWAPRKYSEAFFKWILEQRAADATFFAAARTTYKELAPSAE